jgi:hypothetical protein
MDNRLMASGKILENPPEKTATKVFNSVVRTPVSAGMMASSVVCPDSG